MTLTEYSTSNFVDIHHPSLPLHTYVYSLTSRFSDSTHPLIILLHGAGGDHRQFDTVFPSLIQKGYPVMVPDLRYHGRSQPKDASEPKFDFSVILADLDRALIWFKKQVPHNLSVVVGGLSMGGMIAQLYAQHLTNSCTSGSINLCALIGIGCAHIKITEPSIPWMTFYKTATYADAQEMLPAARHGIIESAHSALGKLVSQSEICLVDDKVLLYCLRACANAASLSNPIHQLSSIPQLLLRGEYDTHTQDVMEAWYTKLKAISPNTMTYHAIPYAGHIVTIDNGDLVSQKIITFLSA